MANPSDSTTTPKLTDRDAMADFERRDVELLGETKRVFVAGEGPAVIVMTEMPGIYAHVARFARFVRDAGFTVWMPDSVRDAGRAAVDPQRALDHGRAPA